MIVRNRHFRSIVSGLVALLLVAVISYLGIHTYKSSHASTGPTIYASPASATLAAGSTLSITVREDSGIESINSVQTTMNYDAAVLEYTSMSEGGTFPIVAATDTSTPGVIRVARAISDGTISGDKPVVTVNFKVIGTTGSGAINFDKAYSYLVRSSDSQDVLQNVVGGTYTVSGSGSGGTTPTPNPTTKPTLYINPSTGTYAPGSTITAAVRVATHSAEVTTIQATVSYPAQQLQYIGVSESGPFVIKQRTNATSGVIDIIRSIPGGGTPVQGDEAVVSLSFKVIGASGNPSLTFTNASAVYDASGTGTNILDFASSGSAQYAISSTTPPVTTTPGTPTTTPTKVTSPAQAVTITTKGASGHAAITTNGDGSTMTELTGEVTLAPVTGAAVDGSNDPIKKVEYYLDSKLISTRTSKPFTFNFNSSHTPNGTHTLVVKTYYASGKVDSRTDTLLIKNKITISYVLRNFGQYIAGGVLVLALLALVVLKFVIPHKHRNDFAAPADPDAYRGFALPLVGRGSSPIAQDPTVVAPTNVAITSSPEVIGSSSATVSPAADTPVIAQSAVTSDTRADPQIVSSSASLSVMPAPDDVIAPTVAPAAVVPEQGTIVTPSVHSPTRTIDGITRPAPPQSGSTGMSRPHPA